MNMDPIEEIRQRLNKYPGLNYMASAHHITVYTKSESNFEVSFAVDSAIGYTVSFEGWHETFASKEEALNCFAMGLSNSCRLLVLTKGTFPYRWQLETLNEGQWTADSEVGLIIFPFWRKTSRLLKQNNYLSEKA
jgi:hypothetical protein